MYSLSWQAIDNQIITQFQTNYEIKNAIFHTYFTSKQLAISVK